MKKKKEDKILRELFRQKLDNAEIIPSPAMEEELFRRLVVKEFLHFDFFRFNIWYAGIIATVCTAALIFFLTPGTADKERHSLPDSDPEVLSISSITDHHEPDFTSADNLIIGKTDKRKIEIKATIGDIQETDEISGKTHERIHNIPLETELLDAAFKNGLIWKTDHESNKLRSIFPASGVIKASVTKGCCPLKVCFQAEEGSFDRCRWTFGDGGVSDEISPVWIYDMPGEYKVTLLAYNSDELYSVSTCIITVFPGPVARFQITVGDESLSDNNNKITLVNYSTNAVEYKWLFGDGNTSELFEPVHVYSESGDYNISLIVTSKEGCTDTTVVINPFKLSENYIRFPNAFLPDQNGRQGGIYSASSDEAASIFHPVSSGVVEYQLKIFSKRGIKVFESNDINNGWDGYYNGRVCHPGVYIWKVRGNFINGEAFTKMGDLTLLKH